MAERVKRTLLAEVKEGGSRGEKAAKALVLIFWQGRRSNATGAAELERETILSQWCAASLAEQGMSHIAVISSIGKSRYLLC